MFVATQAIPEIIDDLIIQGLTTGTPPFRAEKLFDAAAQSAEGDHLWRRGQLRMQFGAQPLKENQFEGLLRARY